MMMNLSSTLASDSNKFCAVTLRTIVLEVALRLLEEYDRAESEWVEEVRVKIDVAIEASNHTAPIDGETFVNSILVN